MNIRPLTIDDALACEGVILSLPYWFGDEQGRRDCFAALRQQRGLVAEVDGEIAGFLTLERHNTKSAEVTWMAVHAEHRRGGIGRRLIDAAVERLRGEGTSMLCVLTLGPSVPEPPDVTDNYSGTRAFYERMGFVPLRELELRSWNNAYALILAKPL